MGLVGATVVAGGRPAPLAPSLLPGSEGLTAAGGLGALTPSDPPLSDGAAAQLAMNIDAAAEGGGKL